MLFERLVHTAEQRPDRVAVADPTRQLTFGELVAGSEALGRAIARLSPKPADPVGLLLPTSVAFATAFHAVQSSGRIALPLNFLLAPPELAAVLADSGAQMVLACRPLAELAEPLAAAGAKVVYIEDLSVAPPAAPAGNYAAPAGHPLPSQKGSGAKADRTAVLLYTSGSTAQPKGVMLSAGNLLDNAQGAIDHARMTAEEHLLGVLPLFHTFGLTALVVIPAVLGATVHYLPRFEPRQVLSAIAERGITVLIAIPSMYGAMLKAALRQPQGGEQGRAPEAGPTLKDCRLLISGGEPLPTALGEAFSRRFDRPILEGYGLTEASPVVSLNVPHAHRPGTVGRPIPNVRVRVLDESGRACPPGVPGEVVVHGPTVMQGYYRRPDDTRAALTDDGGLRTGDIGRIDEDGYLSISGRIKDLIIVGGENVFPAEVETALAAHPKVGRVAVIGLPDGARGEMVAAFLSPADPANPPDAAELRAFCRERLAGYKVPRSFEVLDELPVGPTGKVLKRDLRRRHEQPG